MFQLQAKGEKKGEHTFDKRFAVAQQLHIGRFVLKINGDGPIFAGLTGSGTGSVSCNSVFVLHLCRFLNQEDLMEREAMVQNP
jgi:hypothetical protein